MDGGVESGRKPRLASIARGHGSVRRAYTRRVERRNHEPALRTVFTVPRRSQGEESQESRQPREGQAAPSTPQYLETQAGRDVVPAQRVMRDRARIEKRSQGRRGRTLWRDETQEGIDASCPQGRDGRNELDAGIEALKPTVSARSLGARRIDAGNGRRAGAPERESDRREENALKGEARGRSEAARPSQGRW